MRHFRISAACVVAGVLVWGAPTTGRAQAKQTRGTFTAAAEAGVRTFMDEPKPVDKGKFEEYRSLPAGAVLNRAVLSYIPADSFGVYQLVARRVGQLDQSIWLQATRPGSYNFQLQWDRLQHIYSSTARSPGDEGRSALGFNTLPSPRPDSTAWKNAPYIGNVRSTWDPIKASLALSPSDHLDFKAEFLHIGKKGGLPKSISYSGSSGPTREYVSPIDESMNNFRVSQSFASGERAAGSILGDIIKSYQATVSYEYSRYVNNVSSAMVDNPQLSTPAITGTPTGTNTARVSLAPDNAAQTASFVGAVSLPFRTRVTGSLNASWQTQNEAFLPQFNNSALAADPNAGLLANLRPSLEGKVKLATVNFAATSHPIDRLTLAAKYRNHSYGNETAQGHIRAMAISDRSIALADSLYTEWDPYSKINTDVSAAFELARNASVAVGYAVEDFNREIGLYSVDGTREKIPRLSADYSGIDWLSLHASYTSGERRFFGSYRETSVEVTGNRRAFVADRDRTRTTLMATVTPVDQVSIGLSFQTGDDRYPSSRFGMQSDKSTTTGVDVDWTPVNRLSLGAGYSKEDVDNVFFYRYRAGALGSLTYDNPAFYFTNTNTDRNTTTFASVNAVLVPDKLTLNANMSVIDGHFWMYNVNPNGTPNLPAPATAAQNLTATVENWPEVSSKLTPMALALQYKVNADWAFTLRYNSETYTNHNFQQEAPKFTSTTVLGGTPTTAWTGDLPGNVGATTGSNTGQYHFLGNNYHPYTARWLTVMASWHPSSLPFETGRPVY
jgi:hypothetical protein